MTSDNFIEDYHTIRNELKEYGAGLAKKPEIIALTKMDALGEELAEEQAKEFEEATGKKPFIISAVANQNLELILYKLADIIKIKKQEQSDAAE